MWNSINLNYIKRKNNIEGSMKSAYGVYVFLILSLIIFGFIGCNIAFETKNLKIH